MSVTEQLDELQQQATTYRSLAVEARLAAQDYIEYRDDAPIGFAISNGEMYHAHLRNAEHCEGIALGIEKALRALREGEDRVHPKAPDGTALPGTGA